MNQFDQALFPASKVDRKPQENFYFRMLLEWVGALFLFNSQLTDKLFYLFLITRNIRTYLIIFVIENRIGQLSY